MASEPKAANKADPVRSATTVFLVAILVLSGILIYIAYDNSRTSSAGTSDPVEAGDLIIVDYIGMFEDGRVFDTSILEVAYDDALYPKSLTFSQKDNDSYTPFEMTAGKYGSSGGTIKGFALGVLGMTEGQRKTITVAVGEGYDVNQSMLETIPVVEQLMATSTMSDDEFDDLFSADPVVGNVVPHYKWQWDVVVVSDIAGYVTVKQVPTVGQEVYPFGDPDDDISPAGWKCVVEAYDPSYDGGKGLITVRHYVSPADVYDLSGVTYDGTSFVVSGFDSVNNTFQIHKSNSDIGYNGEIAGRVLIFEVTLVSIKTQA